MRRTGFLKSLLVGGVLAAGSANSAELSRTDISITMINPVATNRPAETWSQDYIKVYINSGSWGGASPCRSDGFLISKADTHLYSALLTAWTAKAKINVSVDNGTSMVQNGEWCTAVLVTIYR